MSAKPLTDEELAAQQAFYAEHPTGASTVGHPVICSMLATIDALRSERNVLRDTMEGEAARADHFEKERDEAKRSLTTERDAWGRWREWFKGLVRRSFVGVRAKLKAQGERIDELRARLAEVERERDENQRALETMAKGLIAWERRAIDAENALRRSAEPRAALEAKLAAAEARAEEAETSARRAEDRVARLVEGAQAHKARAERLEAELLLVADSLGYVNRAEGQAGYERADAATLVGAIAQLKREATLGPDVDVDALDASPPEPAKGEAREQRFVCRDCGFGVAADEDGCCGSCGRTCAMVEIVVPFPADDEDEDDEPAGPPPRWVTDPEGHRAFLRECARTARCAMADRVFIRDDLRTKPAEVMAALDTCRRIVVMDGDRVHLTINRQPGEP